MPSTTDKKTGKSISISRTKPYEAHKLRRVFKHAVASHFNYFPSSYQRQVLKENSFLRLLAGTLRPSRVLIVARYNKNIIGYVIGSGKAGGPGEIYWLYVMPEYRGQNLGLQLLSDSMQELEALKVSAVYLATYEHQAYYARQGFRLQRSDNSYGVPMDIMYYPYKHEI